MHIFISYRRNDTPLVAARLAEDLRRHLPETEVFLDSDTLALGPFPKQIAHQIKNADVMLVLIGPNWFNDGGKGHTGLADENDWVRREITLAVELDMTIVPVLVDNALIPSLDKLPSPLAHLVDHQALKIRPSDNKDWRSDVNRIADELMAIQTKAPPSRDASASYEVAIYAGLVRWTIYEAELGWRVTGAILPFVALLVGIGAAPFLIASMTHPPWKFLVAGTASLLGFVTAIASWGMVSRSRQFFSYRADSGELIEKEFPVAPHMQLFRNRMFGGYQETAGGKVYRFAGLARFTMTSYMRLIYLAVATLLFLLTAANFVQALRAL